MNELTCKVLVLGGGPGGYVAGIRAGQLGLDTILVEGGKLGGTDVELIVEDDGLKPENAQQIADRMIKRDNAEIITGIIFSNISPIVAPMTLGAGRFYISPNSAPSICHAMREIRRRFPISMSGSARRPRCPTRRRSSAARLPTPPT